MPTLQNLFIKIFILWHIPIPGSDAASAAARRTADFGGDFTAGSLSGAEAPGIDVIKLLRLCHHVN